jgi:hypothetical protein
MELSFGGEAHVDKTRQFSKVGLGGVWHILVFFVE